MDSQNTHDFFVTIKNSKKTTLKIKFLHTILIIYMGQIFRSGIYCLISKYLGILFVISLLLISDLILCGQRK